MPAGFIDKSIGTALIPDQRRLTRGSAGCPNRLPIVHRRTETTPRAASHAHEPMLAPVSYRSLHAGLLLRTDETAPRHYSWA